MKLRNAQQGLTVTALIAWAFVVIILTVLGVKVVPDVVEYTKIRSDIRSVSRDPGLKQASVQEIRAAFQRQANVDQISAISPQDLEIDRTPNGPVISFAYTKRISLGGPVSLVIDFAGSSDQ